MKFILNRKSLMTFGKWGLALFSLVLLGFFVVQYIIPILALDPPTQTTDVQVDLISPANNGYSTLANTNFTYNATWNSSAYSLRNCTLFGNFTGNFVANVTNVTMGVPVVNNTINYLNTSVSDGLYIWNVYCYNATDHGNYGSSNYTVTVDLTDPVLNNTYPVNNSYISSATVVFNVSFIEENINYAVNASVYYRREGQTDWQTQILKCYGSAPSFTCNSSSINLANPPISLGEGETLQFFYNTTDSAGRTGVNGTLDGPITTVLDTTDPGSPGVVYHTDDAPSDQYDNDTDIIFNWTAASDTTSGIKQYKIYISDDAGAYVYNGTNTSATGYSFTGVNAHNYSINVTAVDNANNENTTGTVSNVTVIVDTTDPGSPGTVYFETDYDSGSVSYDNDTTLVVNWTAASDTNGIQYYKIYVSENLGTYSYNGTNTSATGYSFPGGDGSNYSVNVTAVDNAGLENETGTVSNTTIYVDTTDPTSPSNVAFEADPTNYYDDDTTVIVNWTAASDATSGIKQYKIYVWTDLNTSDYLLFGTNTSATGYSFTGVNTHNYSVNVTTVDNVNNENMTGTTSNTTITVDTTDPTSPSNVAFEADPTNYYDDDTTVIVNWTAASDATSGIKQYKIYVWTDLNTSDYLLFGTNTSATGYSFAGADGSNYTVNVTAVDNANNENTTGTTSNTTITVDTTDPASIFTVSPTLANESYTSNDFVYVNVTFTESNPDTCLLEYHNGTLSNYTMDRSGTNCYINMTSQPEGDWNYSIYVNDSARRVGKNSTFYVTVDLTDPVLNETTPADGGYFNNPSSLTFQVKLTDQNINYTVNASVYWRRNETGDYQANMTKCYGSAPSYTCNISGINTGLTDTDVLQFFFNTSDKADRTNQTSTFTATVDTSAPTYADNDDNATTIGVGDAVLIYANWTDTYTLGLAWLWTNETGTTAGKNWTSGSYGPIDINLTGSETWSNFTWSNASVTSGTVVGWKIYANDSAGNVNETAVGSFTIDSIAPSYANNGTNATTIGKGDAVIIHANWTDNIDLDLAWLETNETGSAENKSSSTNYGPIDINLTGTQTWSNFTWSNASKTAGTVIQWKIYANDSSSNVNVTTAGTFKIDDTPPTYDMNGTNVTNASTITKGTPILVYANWTDNIRLGYYWLGNTSSGSEVNDTATAFGSNTWTNISIDTSNFPVGTFQAKIYANDSSANENLTMTFAWTIDDTPPTYASNITNVTNTSTIVKGTAINLTAVWSDNIHLDKYWCSNDSSGDWVNITAQDFDSSYNQSDCIIDTSSFTAGMTFNATIYANDTSGNENKTGTFSWTIDGTAPTYDNQSDSVDGDAEYAPGATYTLNISWSDKDGDVSVVLLNFSSLSTNQTADDLASTNYSVTLTDLAVRNYTYQWFANDTSDNWNETIVYAINITQNTTNPIDMYMVNSTNTTKNDNITISAGNTIVVNGTFVHPNSGTIKVYTNATATGAVQEQSSPYTTPSTLGAGEYLFIANTTGTVNYTSNSTGPGTFYLIVTEDTTAPTVLLYDYTNGTVKKSGAELTLNISVDDSTGVSEGETCNVTIAEVLDRTITHSIGWCNGTITVPTVPSDGNYTINITVKDNSTNGNEGYNDSYVLTVDNTTPIVTIIYPATNETYNKSVGDGNIWINGTVMDNIKMGSGNVTINSSYFNASASDYGPFYFDGSNNSAFAFHNTSAIPNGYYAVTINYTDEATNLGEAIVYFYVDNTGPTVFSGLTTGTKASSSSQTVQVNVTDNLMTNASIQLHFKRGSLIDWTVTNMTGTPAASTIYSVGIDTSMLANGEVVYYYVTGTDNATNPFSTNNGTASNPLGYFTIGDVTVPVNPAYVNVSQVGSTREVNVSWVASPSSGVVAYNVYYKLGGAVSTSDNSVQVGNVTKTSITVAQDGTWNFTVTAIDSSDNENTTIDFAATVTVTTTDTTAPLQPTQLSAVQVGSTRQVNISWTASTSSDVTGYYVYRDTGVVTTSSTNLGEAGNTTQFTDTVPADGTWNYTVVAHDEVPNVNTTIIENATVTVTTADTTAPVNPVYVNVTQVGSTREVNISWPASVSSDAVRYNVYYEEGVVSTSSNSFSVGNVTKTSKLVSSDGTWNFTVTAIDSSDNENTTIDFAASIAISTADTTAPVNPVYVNVSQVGSTKQINISWPSSSSSDAVRYNVYYKKGVVTTSSLSFDVANVTDTAFAAPSDGNWNFTVTAIDSSDNENTTIDFAANITIDTTVPGVSSTSPNGTITDSTPTLVINTTENGYCRLDTADRAMSSMTYTMTGSGTGHEYTFSSALSDSVYTYYVKCNDTIGNEMVATSISFNLDTRSLYNITRPSNIFDYWTANQWHTFALPRLILQDTTLTYYNVTSILASVDGNYNKFFVDIGNNETWRSYVPGDAANSFTDFTYNGSASVYYIYMNTTDRLEIN